MRRGEYRKFRIKGEQQNDFAAMREVVERRYRKLLEQGGPFPDLVLIDGGKGQLESAYDAMVDSPGIEGRPAGARGASGRVVRRARPARGPDGHAP